MRSHYKESQVLRSKLTAKAQTTVPTGVRQALGLHAGDTLAYVIEGDHVIVSKMGSDEDADPVLESFLDLLSRDMVENPERLSVIPKSLVKRARDLVRGVRPDPRERISGRVAL